MKNKINFYHYLIQLTTKFVKFRFLVVLLLLSSIYFLALPKYYPEFCALAQLPTCSPSQTPQKTIPKGWINNDRGLTLISEFFNKHQYSDCALHNNGFWTLSNYDCLINDQVIGPTAFEKSLVPEPPNLYYKHFTPLESINIVQNIYSNDPKIDTNEITTSALADLIRNRIADEIKKNPYAWVDKSFDSIYLGIEGGRDGSTVRTASILVHPFIERLIANAKETNGIEGRVKAFFAPFVESAIGERVSIDKVIILYENALNRCGDNALGGDKSGLGTLVDFGNYIGVVEYWESKETANYFTNAHDCRIHLLKKT